MPAGLGKTTDKRFDPHDHLVSQGWKGKGTGEWLVGTIVTRAPASRTGISHAGFGIAASAAARRCSLCRSLLQLSCSLTQS